MKTVEEIKSSPDLMSGLELLEEKLSVYMLFNENGIEYFAFWRGEAIFLGNKFKRSPLYKPYSLECMIQLLHILCAKRDDNFESFDEYTVKQIEWSESPPCHELRKLIDDFEGGTGNESYTYARRYFEMHFFADV